MSELYWKDEISVHPNKTISVRGNTKCLKETYNEYLDEFLETYKGKITSMSKTDIIHVDDNQSEYCTMITVNMKDVAHSQFNNIDDKYTESTPLMNLDSNPYSDRCVIF